MRFTAGADSHTALWPADEPGIGAEEWGFTQQGIEPGVGSESYESSAWDPGDPTWETLEGDDPYIPTREPRDLGPYDVPRPTYCDDGFCERRGQFETGLRTAADVIEEQCFRSGGDRLTPPPFENLHWFTDLCFRYEHGASVFDWPAHECDQPCVAERPCDLPSPDEGARAGMQVYVIPSDIDPLPGSWRLLPPGTDLSTLGWDAVVVQVAAALLEQHIDLVEWAVCLSASWSPNVTDPQSFVDCALDGIRGAKSIYLLDRFIDSQGRVDGATGGATNAFYRQPYADSSSLPGTGVGPTVPVGHSKWRSSASAYRDALSNPAECPRGLCALAHCAGILLHELLHQCSYDLLDDPRGEDNPTSDDFQCWAIQNMAASAFSWALSQRFPELQGLACCPANTAEWFMHSGDIGTFNPPYPWNENAPC